MATPEPAADSSAELAEALTTVTPEPTSTPSPGGCTNGMQFLADVTIPDGAILGPNECFVKTWRVRNRLQWW